MYGRSFLNFFRRCTRENRLSNSCIGAASLDHSTDRDTAMGWIGVGLDGTLAQYESWVSPKHIGPPVPKMLERVKRWIAEGREVRIFTARVSDPTQAVDARRAIEAWLLNNGLPMLSITCCKDFGMSDLWD